jgi:hypothetical protein
MPALVAGIHVSTTKTWMAGIGERSDAVLRTALPAMTVL